MKIAPRYLFAVLCVFCTELFAGNLTVSLSPTTAVSAGAQWRVDGGSWRNSGATVKNLSNSDHLVEFRNVSGWLTPASQTVAITAGKTIAATATYLRPAALTIALTPSSGQWRIDGGAWRASGSTVTGLTPGVHTVQYSTLSGYTAPVGESITLIANQATTLARNYTQLAQVSVMLLPSTAQWRIDGGVWQNSGTTAANLLPGTHTIDYAPVSGYLTAPSETITLNAGQSLPLNRTYVQLAQLSVTLNPAHAQWRVDGGVWQGSGATVADLTPGNHTVEYLTLTAPNWGTPPAETVALNAGQSLNLQRAYFVLGQVLIALVPSTGTWRLNGGAWQPSGSSLWVPAGSYSIDYSAVEGYDAPPADTFTNGFIATRYYTSIKPTLRIHLSPTAGQWRIDGGSWQNSGTQLTDLTVGSHTIDYSDLGGDYNPLTAETISLALRENATLSRSYSLKPAALSIVLSPSHAQWRIVGGATSAWQSSGAVLSNLQPGTYTVEYSSLVNHDAPANESITLAPNQSSTLTRSYTPHPAQVSLTLEPTSGQWRPYPILEVPSGPWFASGATVTGLAPGRYRADFSDITGHAKPSLPAFDLAPGQQLALSAAYTPIPPSIYITITPSTARYRINGGDWLQPTSFWTALPSAGTYLLEFSTLNGYETPAPQILDLAWGETRQIPVSYVPLMPGILTVHTSPGGGQFRVDGGVWNPSGTTVNPVQAGTHQIEFSAQTGYLTPAAVTLQIAPSETRTYTQPYYVGAATLKVHLQDGIGRWRADGGEWISSGWIISFGSGPHTIEYEPVAGYVAPPTENILLAVDENRELTRNYRLPTAGVTVALTPASGQWRIYTGPAPTAWNPSGATVSNLVPASYTIDYSPVPGYTAPPSETLSLAAGDTRSFTRSYVAPANGFTEVVAFPDLGYQPSLIRGTDGVLYGLTNQQGGNVGGALFRINPDGTGYSLLRAFPDHTGDAMSPTALVDGSDGFLYGTSQYGGAETNRGVIFRCSHDATVFTILRVFVNAAEGHSPNTLLEASDDWLYGTALNGGLNNRGLIFKINKAGSGYTVLKEFGSVALEGRFAARLTEGGDGALYGTVSAGGTSNLGIVYRINKDGSGYSVLKNFSGGADGAGPRVSLFRASDGYFYGSTASGGTFNRGTAFRLNADGTGHVVLKNFAGDTIEGGAPASEFAEDASGVLYGATSNGGPGARGTVFKINRDGSGHVTLKTFSGTATEGGFIAFAPVVVGNGVLNGVSRAGGAGGEGVLFRLNTDGSGFSALKHFGAPFGGLIMTPVVEGPDGALYGSAYIGGLNREGTIFKVNKDGTGLSVLRHFSALRTGFAQSVIKGSDGLIYGVAAGANSSEIYRMNPDGSSLTSVRTFVSAEGSPQAVTEASDGVLYGTTSGGGTANLGSVFKINKNGSGFTTLRSFTGGSSDGKWPYCGVIEGRDGVLYGTTYSGGPADGGTIYRVAKDGSGYAVLKHLNNVAIEGAQPHSPPLHHTDGFLYGVLQSGGTANFGTIYRLGIDGSSFTVLRSFLGSAGDGAGPNYAGLAEHNGKFYGVTAGGGVFGRGTLFSLSPDGTNYSTMINFGATGFEGSVPAATLLRATDGALYGTTFRGGVGPVIFRLQTN